MAAMPVLKLPADACHRPQTAACQRSVARSGYSTGAAQDLEPQSSKARRETHICRPGLPARSPFGSKEEGAGVLVLLCVAKRRKCDTTSALFSWAFDFTGESTRFVSRNLGV